MKYIIAVIQPDRLDEVLERLTEKEIHLVTVSNALGRGRQKGISEVYRSHKEAGSLLKKVKVEMAVNDDYAENAIEAVLGGAQSGQIVHYGDSAFRLGGGVKRVFQYFHGFIRPFRMACSAEKALHENTIHAILAHPAKMQINCTFIG